MALVNSRRVRSKVVDDGPVIRCSSSSPREPLVWNLIGPSAEEKIDDVAFVRLEPVEFGGRDRADVQAVDVRRVG